MTVPERWEDFDPDLQDAILRVSAGEITADEAREQLQQRGDED